MCGGGGYPPDRSVELRQLELDAEQRRRTEEQAAEEQMRQELAQLRSDATGFGRSSAEGYFQSQGLVPDDYITGIERQLQSILGGIPRDDPNPSSYFTNIGPQAYQSEQEAFRNRLMRELDRIAPPNFENTRIASTLDDPTLGAVQAEHRGNAESIVKNMLDRGVITDAGYQGALADLDRQGAGVTSRLGELGNLALEGGRQTLRDTANTGRSTASQINLGTQFDPFSVGSEIDQEFSEFINSLGTNIRGRVQGDLYDTAGLARVAGQAQGGQNTAFNPAALAGIIGEDDDEEEQSNIQPAGVF
jgi:hypothetical protein